MFRNTTFSICILILLVACVGFGFQPVRSVGAATTWTVDDDEPADFSTIQEAINTAVDGDTIFVKTGTYYEHVAVNKSVSLIGEYVNATIIDGNHTGHVVSIISDYVNVTSFTVQKSGNVGWPALDAGFCLNGTIGCTISENHVTDNGFCGISLLNSQQNTIMDNNLAGTDWGGIHLLNSSYNTILRNLLYNNTHVGINGHAASHYNNITENVISNSTYGMFYHDIHHNHICRNNISTISADGIWFQEQGNYNVVAENNLVNTTVGIRLEGPNYNNTLSRNVVTGAEFGIRIQNYARYTHIIDNIIMNNRAGNDSWSAGIRLDRGRDSQIHFNIITGNYYGILLYSSSPRVSVYGNNITGNEFGLRVASEGSNYLTVSDNIVMNNQGYGIGVTGFGGASNYATISRNLIVNNSDGIALGQYSNCNTILQNNISQNDYGFYIDYSTQNTIRENNIFDNDQQVYVSTGSVNNWDDGYPAGGNYWSDFTGADLNHGLSQNITGSDGIGDTPYTIDDNNTDRYPLMKPWIPKVLQTDLNNDGTINIVDVTIVAIAFGSTPEDPNWNIMADLNNDEVINIIDIVVVAVDFGKNVETTTLFYTCNVVNVYPHDADAFTQGLVFENGTLYESTGLYGNSTLRRVELETGEIQQLQVLPDQFFGEGTTIFDDKIIQLTWESNTGFVYDIHSFELLQEFYYPTEGWGITHNGSLLIMSDGTATLFFLNPETFEVVRQVEVYYDDEPVTRLNELEYVEGDVYANIWKDERIAVINPQTGQVKGWIDLSDIADLENGDVDNLLNGIAYDAKEDRLFITGKRWAHLYEIELVPT